MDLFEVGYAYGMEKIAVRLSTLRSAARKAPKKKITSLFGSKYKTLGEIKRTRAAKGAVSAATMPRGARI